ncbi:MAG TPA: biopolymer transporter ExbD [Blastocatellia bacterium]|jgi:biopolymer transport protein ExbD|nr:biopolymer transporter ExbD [Blastocatellia bacterium]
MAMGGGASTKEATPYINMTPMIDILLVLLIIFMVISPKKPHRFESQIPQKPPENQPEQPPDPLALLVTIPMDGGKYKLNNDEYDSLKPLGERLFKALDGRPSDRKAVFIKAPRQLNYGEVVRVIDVVKQVGGAPIGLQIEGLDER